MKTIIIIAMIFFAISASAATYSQAQLDALKIDDWNFMVSNSTPTKTATTEKASFNYTTIDLNTLAKTTTYYTIQQTKTNAFNMEKYWNCYLPLSLIIGNDKAKTVCNAVRQKWFNTMQNIFLKNQRAKIKTWQTSKPKGNDPCGHRQS